MPSPPVLDQTRLDPSDATFITPITPRLARVLALFVQLFPGNESLRQEKLWQSLSLHFRQAPASSHLLLQNLSDHATLSLHRARYNSPPDDATMTPTQGWATCSLSEYTVLPKIRTRHGATVPSPPSNLETRVERLRLFKTNADPPCPRPYTVLATADLHRVWPRWSSPAGPTHQIEMRPLNTTPPAWRAAPP